MADWSELEVDVTIEDYFQMLHKEIKGIPYNKTAHRSNLLKLLNNRSNGAIESKHQNISAILINNGLPYIKGYKPLGHFQKLLEEKVLTYLSRDVKIEVDFNEFANQKINLQPKEIEYAKLLVAPPPSTNILHEPKEHYYSPKKRNYLELEQKNKAIGFIGEELAFEYEKWRLKDAGYSALAKEVQWVSKEQGDGAGYDILSKTIKGEDIFIEVKTTTLGIDTPIFFSKTENDFSNDFKKAFYLYRVFDVKQSPKMFTRNGSFKDICQIEAVGFKGTF